MIRPRTLVFIFAVLTAPFAFAHAQALPTATRNATIQAGVAAMSLNTDYTARHTAGLMGFANYDFIHLFHLDGGVEGEARFGGLHSPDDIGENSYLVGPRISYRRRQLKLYGKIMGGRGTIFHDAPNNNNSSSFYLIGAGGGLEYRVKQHFNVRILDVEGQRWRHFPPNGLTPLALSAGVAYIIR